MKLISMLSAFLLSASAFATPQVNCTVKVTQDADNSVFTDFDGGAVSIDLSNGNVSVAQRAADAPKILVSQKIVSSFQAKRASCKPTSKIEKRSDGSLKSFQFSFEDCELKNPSIPLYTAYVGVHFGFNFETKAGVYQELFYDGNTKSPGFFLEECSVQ